MSDQAKSDSPTIEEIRAQARQMAAEQKMTYRDALKKCLGVFVGLEAAKNTLPGDHVKTVAIF